MKRNWLILRRTQKVSDAVRNIRKVENRSRKIPAYPISNEEFVHRPFVDRDIAIWEFVQRTQGKGLALIKNSEDPQEVKKNIRNTFQVSMAPILFVAELIGLFPIHGVRRQDMTELRFKWKSWKTLYTLTNLAIGFTVCSLSIYRICADGLDLNKAGALVFYTTVTINLILFLRLSPEWESLVRDVTTTETACPYPLYSGRTWSLRARCMIIGYSIMMVSSLEHGWSNISLLTSAYACVKENTVIYDFYTQSFPPIFRVMKYQFWKGLFMQVWNAIATAIWNFSDVFLIVISYNIIHRFKLLSFWLDMTNGQRVSEKFWRSMRSEYLRLSLMVKRIDKAVNPIMTLSFASNLYIICEQMFNSLKEKNFNAGQTECEEKKDDMVWPAVIDIVYFSFSFSYLIFRFFAVSMTAAEVYTSARRPKEILHCVPSYNYSTEVQRFLDQVSTDKIALTGKNLFSITRSLILAIVGTIITYELVLVQFYSSSYPSQNGSQGGIANNTAIKMVIKNV